MTPDPEWLDRVIEQLRRGIDRERNFRRLFDAFYEVLMGFLASLRIPINDRPDLAQDVFLKVFQHLEGFRGRAKFKTWLFQITRNLANNYWRDRHAAKRSAVEVSTTLLEEVGHEIADAAVRNKPLGDPEQVTEERQSSEQLRKVCGELPRQMRRCVALSLDGRTHAEIARLLGIKVGTVKAQLFQARQRLRKLLDADLGLPESTEDETKDGEGNDS